MSTLSQIDPTTLTLLVTALVLAVAIVGYAVGRRNPSPAVKSWSSDALQQATFTIVGLLLAFTFSLALARFDARRVAVVNESNAITTTILRSELLNPETARVMRGDLRAYLDAREASLAPDATASQRQGADQQTKALELSMWRHAVSTSSSQPSQIAVFFLTALGQMFDAASVQDAAAAAHIPTPGPGAVARGGAHRGVVFGLPNRSACGSVARTHHPVGRTAGARAGGDHRLRPAAARSHASRFQGAHRGLGAFERPGERRQGPLRRAQAWQHAVTCGAGRRTCVLI